MVDNVSCNEIPAEGALGEENVEDVVFNILATAATENVATAHGIDWAKATIDDPLLNGVVPLCM